MMNTPWKTQISALLLALFWGIAPALALASEPAAPQPLELLHLISENSKLDLTPYEGKAVFLNFFTEWCGYCMQEMPDIQKAFETYSQDDLQIVLIHPWDGEDAKNTESVRKRFGMEAMTFYEDETLELPRAFQLQGYPTSIFIDKEGNFFDLVVGMLTPEALDAILNEMSIPKKAGHDD